MRVPVGVRPPKFGTIASMSAHRIEPLGVDLPSNRSVPEEPLAFLELVDAVEVASAGRTLEGRAREQALEAFLTCPRGFRVVAERAAREATSNACGLLTWAVGRGQHEKAER